MLKCNKKYKTSIVDINFLYLDHKLIKLDIQIYCVMNIEEVSNKWLPSWTLSHIIKSVVYIVHIRLQLYSISESKPQQTLLFWTFRSMTHLITTPRAQVSDPCCLQSSNSLHYHAYQSILVTRNGRNPVLHCFFLYLCGIFEHCTCNSLFTSKWKVVGQIINVKHFRCIYKCLKILIQLHY